MVGRVGRRVRIIVSQIVEPWWNLAVEDYLLRQMGDAECILLLWRNRTSVVIGRAQNPWLECHLAKMAAAQVPLVRRQSGGGAVFCDLGNSNFTFFSGRRDWDKSAHHQMVCRALGEFGIDLYSGPRHDLWLAGGQGLRKVSGSAFKESGGRCLHHGTLLIDADLVQLRDYLCPRPKPLVSRGVASVRAPVANLSGWGRGLDHHSFCQALAGEFQRYWGVACEVEVWGEEELGEISLRQSYERFRGWQWSFGQTPYFTHDLRGQFSWGTVEARLISRRGRVVDIEWGFPAPPLAVQKLLWQLREKPYGRQGVEAALQVPGMGRDPRLLEFAAWAMAEMA